MPLPDSEKHYCWMQLASIEDQPPRLLIPHADPNEYEYILDILFDSPEQAVQMLFEWVQSHEITQKEADSLILCKRILIPIERPV